MKVTLHSDEINLLIYRYLQESGFVHTAFTLGAEANLWQPINLSTTSGNNGHVNRSLIDQLGPRLPPNCLVSILQKALLYIWIEHHTDPETGAEIQCNQPFGLFHRHECCMEDGNNSEDLNNESEEEEEEGGGDSDFGNVAITTRHSSSLGPSSESQPTLRGATICPTTSSLNEETSIVHPNRNTHHKGRWDTYKSENEKIETTVNNTKDNQTVLRSVRKSGTQSGNSKATKRRKVSPRPAEGLRVPSPEVSHTGGDDVMSTPNTLTASSENTATIDNTLESEKTIDTTTLESQKTANGVLQQDDDNGLPSSSSSSLENHDNCNNDDDLNTKILNKNANELEKEDTTVLNLSTNTTTTSAYLKS